MMEHSTILNSAFPILHSALLAGAAASFAVLLAFAATWLVGLVRRTPWLSLVVTLFFSGVAVMYGGAKPGGANEVMRIENGELKMENGGVAQSATSTILHSTFYILPSNGVRHDKWWKRGAYV